MVNLRLLQRFNAVEQKFFFHTKSCRNCHYYKLSVTESKVRSECNHPDWGRVLVDSSGYNSDFYIDYARFCNFWKSLKKRFKTKD